MIKLTWNENFEKSLNKYITQHPDKETKIKEKLKVFTKEPIFT
jgi:mRNA-degrading endonuclease YafQ of YafQ-DinJ toxin-antitoxin module